jgi:hypothetical protein
VTAEPRIVAANLALLEQVSGKPRKRVAESVGPAAQAILKKKPMAYWRLGEMEGPIAVDTSDHQHDGVFEPGVVFYLPGPNKPKFTTTRVNRCAHFAGGRMRVRLGSLQSNYRLTMSFWNGMPEDGRETTGWLFSRDHSHAIGPRGEHLGIGGTATKLGRLIFKQGLAKPVAGKTKIKRWTWNQISIVRSENRMRVYLNGAEKPELDVAITKSDAEPIETLFFGGRSDNDSNWEGRIDEIAIYNGAES